MAYDKRTIAALVVKYLYGNLTGDEEITLNNWINEDAEHKALFEEWAGERDLIGKMADYEFIERRMDTDWAKLSAKHNIKPAKQPVLLRRYVRLIAAAAVILAGVCSIWLIVHQKNEPGPGHVAAVNRFKNDVSPGTNKAVLTLSDGSVIVLDSAREGALAKQGNIEIIKLDSGRLAYRVLPKSPGKLLYNTISTPAGGQYQVMLPDGTSVWLNAASSLRYPAFFSGNERSVELTGEAYFEVAKNRNAPFFVRAKDNATVRVLGTHFNVMSYPDEPAVKTTLLEGLVQVSTFNKNAFISPGQEAAVHAGTIQVANVDAQAAVAWKNGIFLFHNVSIESVMRQVSRWYDIEVSYEVHLKDGLSGTIPRKTSLIRLLSLLEQTGQVAFRIDGRNVTVISPDNK